MIIYITNMKNMLMIGKKKFAGKMLYCALFAQVFVCCTSVKQKSANFTFQTSNIRKEVNDLYNKMSVEERAAQLYGIRPQEVMTDGKLSLKKCKEKIPYGVGHICQFACALDLGPNELRDFVRDLQEYLVNETPSGIPAIFHEEAITGFSAKGSTIYPQQLGVACTWNTDLAREKTQQTARSMRAVGATMALSPMVDLIRTAHWSRVEESYGEDPYLTAAMGSAFVEGIQGGDLRKGVAACTKHFLGYGGGSKLPWKEIYEEILFPHEVAIRQAGSKTIMTSYGSFKNEPAVASETLLNVVLKDYLQFDGLAVSDYGAVGYISQSDPESLKKTATAALNAGNDLEFPSGSNYKYLPELLRKGLVNETRFEEAVKKALALKVRLGLLDKKAKLYETGNLNLDTPRDRETAYKLACQSVVMLKNNGILPLTEKSKKIALVGPNANTFWCMLGDYTYQSMQFFWWGGKIDPNEPKIVSLHEALTDKLDADVTLNYERGCDWSESNEASVIREGDPRTKRLKMMLMESADVTDWKKAVKVASGSDVVIAALGENPTLCGEARNRKGIRLPGEQEKFLKELIATGKPVVLVMFGGRPQVIDEVEKGCAAVLQAWYPGEEGGNAVADIILGNVNPSGKLSISYPKTEKQEQYCYNYGVTSDNIAYPFGYGLSYTSYEYSNISVPAHVRTKDITFEITCMVKNTGSMAGTEIVQLYASPKSGQALKPIQLKGFTRVELKPGESKKISFTVSPQQMAYFAGHQWIIEPGDYEFKLGASSSDIRLKSTCRFIGDRVNMDLRNILLSASRQTFK